MAFIFHNIWDIFSHWRTHIFQDGYRTTNQQGFAMIVSIQLPWIAMKLDAIWYHISGQTHVSIMLMLAVDEYTRHGGYGSLDQHARQKHQLPKKFHQETTTARAWMIWVWVNTYIDTFLVGWTSIYQLFWGSLGTRVLTHCHMLWFGYPPRGQCMRMCH